MTNYEKIMFGFMLAILTFSGLYLTINSYIYNIYNEGFVKENFIIKNVKDLKNVDNLDLKNKVYFIDFKFDFNCNINIIKNKEKYDFFKDNPIQLLSKDVFIRNDNFYINKKIHSNKINILIENLDYCIDNL